MPSNKVTILISNFNYEKYILETVNSALSQTYSNIQLIIVDDGSTDKSTSLIKSHYNREIQANKLILLEKENGGQLSTLNYALPYIDGEFVFLLDSDDLYKIDHVEKTVKLFEENKDVDFIFSGVNEFVDNINNIQNKRRRFKNNLKIGYSLLSALYDHEWLGDVTSSISLRKSLLKNILPISGLERDWRVRADDCIVWGASLNGAIKFYNADSAIYYRIHDKNNFYGQMADKDPSNKKVFYDRKLKVYKLFNYFISHFNLGFENINESQKIRLLINEYEQRADRSYCNLHKKYMKCIDNLCGSFFLKRKYKKKIIKRINK